MTTEKSDCVMSEATQKNHWDEKPFDTEFDQQLGKELCLKVQNRIGCFFCHNPNASRKCSACKVAVYCDVNCQKQDWKKDFHKETCAVYRENRDANKECIPICLRSCGWIDEIEFSDAMAARRELFLSAFLSCSKKDTFVSIQTAVVYMFDSLHLVAAANFTSDWNVQCVNRIMMEAVAEGQEAKNLLYKGSGSLSAETKEVVVRKWLDFATQLHQKGVSIISITFGRGLMDLVDDPSFKNRFEETGCKNTMFVPSMDYMFG